MSGGAADIHPYVLQTRRGNSLYVSACFKLAEYVIKFHRRVEYRSLGYRRRGDYLFEYSPVSKYLRNLRGGVLIVEFPTVLTDYH